MRIFRGLGKKGMDFPTVIKIIFVILLMLALIYGIYKMSVWILGTGSEQTSETLFFGAPK